MKHSTIKLIAISIITLSCYAQAFSQTEEILDIGVVDENERLDKGPNLKKFSHFYLSLAPMFNIENAIGSEVIPAYSIYTQLGVRNKRKLCEYYSLGYDISYSRLNYRIDQSATKLVPDTMHFDKEKLIVNNFGLEVYNRFNFSRNRGNHLGYYIDMGAFANWMFSAKHIGKNIGFDATSKSTVQKITNTQLDFVNGFNYGVRARMGYRKYILFGEYRLSELFNDNYPAMPELPGVIIGFQIGLY